MPPRHPKPSREKARARKCPCGCGKYIKDTRTIQLHLQGKGPAAAQLQYVLNHGHAPEPSSSPSIPPLSVNFPSNSADADIFEDSSIPINPGPMATQISSPPVSTITNQGFNLASQSPKNTSTNIPPFSPPIRRPELHQEEDIFECLSDSNSNFETDLEDYDPLWDIEKEWQEALVGPDLDAGLDPMEILGVEFQREVAEMRQGDILSGEEHLITRAFNYKVDTCLPVSSYDKLPLAFTSELRDLPSLFRVQSTIARLSGILPIKFDCCAASCIAYTGQYKDLDECPFCRLSRRTSDGKPRKQFSYLPIKERLVQVHASEKVAGMYDYRAEHDRALPHGEGCKCDVLDGGHYRSLKSERVVVNGKVLPHRFFSDRRDMALGLSLDGFCPFKRRTQTCWPIILFNYNLPPEIRFHMENVICVGVIPGPTQFEDVDSFLVPLITELQALANGVRAYDFREHEIFSFHAYLILVFGDIPAMAKVMSMKGHNGISPCRMCNIKGTRGPPLPGKRKTTLYVPLHRETGSYDPLALPLRTHKEFLKNAAHVLNEPIATKANNLAKQCGIKGLPALAAVPGLSLPTSFPYDIMHLIWENVIKGLILLWTNEFTQVDPNSQQSFHIPKAVWEAIGEATSNAGSTLPAAFGCRVPNIATKRSEFTAEAWSIWTLYLGPVLLERRFVDEAVYRHFVELVRLINLCLQFTLSPANIRDIRQGFARWVKEYERIYYQYDPERVAVCTLNIHGLLHIADSIVACGPVWCYWAYPMERFCGALQRIMKSRRFPFASLDKRVQELAQLAQVKTLFGLHKDLDLSKVRAVENTGIKFPDYPDHVVLIKKELNLASLPCYGKLQECGQGDMMHASKVVSARAHARDMTWITYQELRDRNERFKNLPADLYTAQYYGQLEYILSLQMEPNPAIPQLRRGTHLLLAAVRTCNLEPHGTSRIRYIKKPGKLRIIDVKLVRGLVGRVYNPVRGREAIIERDSVLRALNVHDFEEAELEANSTLAQHSR